MKLPQILLFLLGALSSVAQEPATTGSPEDLAAPLRKFDRNKDGVLTGDESKLARQAHNRGGREAEPGPGRWRELLERREREFTKERQRDFDLNDNGKLDDSEKKELQAVWQKLAEKLTALRVTIAEKYDRNDDGELNEQERNASRAESDRLRREAEDQLIMEWKSQHAPKPDTKGKE